MKGSETQYWKDMQEIELVNRNPVLELALREELAVQLAKSSCRHVDQGRRPSGGRGGRGSAVVRLSLRGRPSMHVSRSTPNQMLQKLEV